MTSDSWVIESLSAHHQDKKKKITKTFLVFTSRKLHWLQYLVWGNTTAFRPWLCPEQKITFFLHILFFPFLYYQRSNKNIGNYDWEDCSISDLVYSIKLSGLHFNGQTSWYKDTKSQNQSLHQNKQYQVKIELGIFYLNYVHILKFHPQTQKTSRNHSVLWNWSCWFVTLKVITPEDIMNPNVDALSVMTYVLYFLTAKLKPGANTDSRKSDDPTAVETEWKKIQQNTFTD